MSDDKFDAIVIGAGMAGLCCAGELIVQGKRPLLISETQEVGRALRAQVVGGNRGTMQLPTYQIGWGGGWWPKLVRQLNVPIRVPEGFNAMGLDMAYEGLGIKKVPQTCVSAAELVSVFTEAFPIDAALANELERVLTLALAIPYQELLKMHELPLVQWLADQKADDGVVYFMLVMASLLLAAPDLGVCREFASIYGIVGTLRSCFCSEAIFGYIDPDPRTGLAVPLARRIEELGGTIWRGRRVAHVETDQARVGKVVMADGTEVSADHVAIAAGNSRIGAILSKVPPEAKAALDASAPIEHKDFNVFAVLDKPVVPREQRNWVAVLNQVGEFEHWYLPLHAITPWAVQPGKQFLATGVFFHPADEFEKQGGEAKVLARLLDKTEEWIPGYKDAISEIGIMTHEPGHLWFDNAIIGPKLPRKSDSVEGLWFVGEGSEPTAGIWMEAAASAGILGARSIAAQLNGVKA